MTDGWYAKPGTPLWNKVPEVTIFFWIIKILATTVGETAADYLNENLGLGLTVTTYVMTVLLVIALFFQFRARKYTPGIYWLAVVLISIVGTLITIKDGGRGMGTTATSFIFVALIASVVLYLNISKHDQAQSPAIETPS